MFSTAYAAGATSKSVYVRGYTASTGLPYTAGAHNTSGITANYVRAGAAATSISLVTQTAGGAYSSGGFVHVAGGVYRLDLPNAALTSGVDYVDVFVFGITDVVFTTAHIDIMGGDPRAANVAANVTQIAGQTASASGTVTFPAATLASTTNITAAAGIAVSSIGANVITAASIASNAITDAKINAGAITNAKFATGAIASSTFATGAINAAAIAADAIGASELAADAVTEIATGVWAAATRTLSAGTNIVLAKGTGVTGFNDLDAAGVRSAVGLSSANLDTQLSTIDTVVDRIEADTIAIEADTQDIQGRIPTALVSGKMDSNVARINDVEVGGGGAAPDNTWGPAA